jgi:hypothetical protein
MRTILLLLLFGMATSIGACSKCDFPSWPSFNACHREAPTGR